MRILQAVTLVASLGVVTSASICRPALLAGNKFLVDFVNHEYINVLAVIVTVSLVSVTQIHLEYSRIERRFNMRVFSEARDQINLGALIMTTMLILAFVISFSKAEFASSPAALSFTHGLALLTVLVSVFIMYDLVRTVYALASEEPIDGDETDAAEKPADTPTE